MDYDVRDRIRWAVKHNNLAVLQRLVRRYPQYLENLDPANGWSSLHYASDRGYYQICVFLIGQGHDKSEISLAHDRSTALHLAAQNNHEQTVHFLAQHIPRCLDWLNAQHESALMVAARRGNDPCVTLLLDFGADIDLSNGEQNRPVHIAAAYGHLKTLRTLVDRNADVQTPNAEGWRPVQYCSTYQVQDYLQSLIHEKTQRKMKKAKASSAAPSTTQEEPDAVSAPTATSTTNTALATTAASTVPNLGTQQFSSLRVPQSAVQLQKLQQNPIQRALTVSTKLQSPIQTSFSQPSSPVSMSLSDSGLVHQTTSPTVKKGPSSPLFRSKEPQTRAAVAAISHPITSSAGASSVTSSSSHQRPQIPISSSSSSSMLRGLGRRRTSHNRTRLMDIAVSTVHKKD